MAEQHVGLLVIRRLLVILGTYRVTHSVSRCCLLTSLVAMVLLGHLVVVLALGRQRTILRNLIVFSSLLLFRYLLLICCSLLNLSNRDPHKILWWSNSCKGSLLGNV
jgi:hypothetical protein